MTELVEAALDLGAGPLRAFARVIVPLTLPGIMVGAFLTFVLAIGDYITPQILGGNNELLMPQLIMMQIGRRGVWDRLRVAGEGAAAFGRLHAGQPRRFSRGQRR